MPVLEVKRLKKSFGQTAVLKGIDFSIEQGQALSIIGPSGSGKTTLLRCLNFLELADGGTISVNGAVIYRGGDSKKHSDAEIRKKRLHFGLVFQNFNLFPQYTALKNVTLAGEMLARERPDYRAHKNEILAEIEENARALLDQVGLSDKLDFYPHQLSGGQQQRVAIARALALKPDILCFDEPTSALDPELTGEVLKVIRSLAEKNTTMVIVTHEMQFARDVSDIVLFIDGGIVVESGPPEQIFDNPRAMRTRQFLERYNGT